MVATLAGIRIPERESRQSHNLVSGKKWSNTSQEVFTHQTRITWYIDGTQVKQEPQSCFTSSYHVIHYLFEGKLCNCWFYLKISVVVASIGYQPIQLTVFQKSGFCSTNVEMRLPQLNTCQPMNCVSKSGRALIPQRNPIAKDWNGTRPIQPLACPVTDLTNRNTIPWFDRQDCSSECSLSDISTDIDPFVSQSKAELKWGCIDSISVSTH